MEKRRQWLRKKLLLFFGALLFLPASPASSQQSAPSVSERNSVAASKATTEGIFLVFPFENAATTPRLDWIGEGLEELTIQRLSAAGQQVYSHAGRINEMDLYGLPASAKLSRATMLHIAQELDADYVVFGSFVSDGQTLTMNARLLRINPIALLPAVRETGPLSSFMDLHNRLVWRLLRAADANFPLSVRDFAALQRPVGLAAFEQYIRGLLAGDDDARLRSLKEAARLEPDWPDPAFAIAEVYLQKNDCNSALPWLSKVPAGHPQSVEAVFATGVCRLREGQPEKAEEVFATLQEDLHRNLISGGDLPEILNNLGIARARQDNLPAALTVISRANDIDPDEDDYPFNLGLLALQQKDYARAETHLAEAVRREPENAEDRAFLIYCLDKEGKKQDAVAARTAAAEIFGDKGLPVLKFDSKNDDAFTRYQRIMKQLDTTSLRLELQGPQKPQGNGDSATPKDASVAHLRAGRQELSAGRLDAAEKEFRAAIAADTHNASAHRELAEILRRRGKLDDAAHELQLSLAERDSAAVHTTLAHIYLEQKKPDLARTEAEKAVKLAPNYTEAKDLLERLQKGKTTGGGQ
jgi:tetratricopeptide (TPR) repeat protein/TolB-like protein